MGIMYFIFAHLTQSKRISGGNVLMGQSRVGKVGLPWWLSSVTSCLNCSPEKSFSIQSYSKSLEVVEAYQKGCWPQLVRCVAPLLWVLIFAREYWGGIKPERFQRQNNQSSGLKCEVQGAKWVHGNGKVRFRSEVTKGTLESHSQAGEARQVWYSNNWTTKGTGEQSENLYYSEAGRS